MHGDVTENDLLEFLLCVLQKDKLANRAKEGSVLKNAAYGPLAKMTLRDDESFIIDCEYASPNEDDDALPTAAPFNMAISLASFTAPKDASKDKIFVVQFTRSSGDMFHFYNKVKFIKAEYLYPLSEHFKLHLEGGKEDCGQEQKKEV